MYKIVTKRVLNPTIVEMDILAPEIATKAKPGEFIILRVDEDGERIPLTIAGEDLAKGTVKIIFQIVGSTTYKLGQKKEGESIQDFVGPLGRATELDGLKKVCIIGGGAGSAIAMPIAQELHRRGAIVHSIVGFRNKDLVILEDEFKACSDILKIMTDDGSAGEKGLVTNALESLLNEGNVYDEVIAIGPIVMMKFVAKMCKEKGIKIVVSMNPIMIDGTGMCGGCRLTVGGKTKFACVDGPDFDGAEVDFDEARCRGGIYREWEKHKYEETCNLFKEAK